MTKRKSKKVRRSHTQPEGHKPLFVRVVDEDGKSAKQKRTRKSDIIAVVFNGEGRLLWNGAWDALTFARYAKKEKMTDMDIAYGMLGVGEEAQHAVSDALIKAMR